MHPPPSNMAQNSTTLYQTITNTLGKTSTGSHSSSSSASNRCPPSQRSPPSSSLQNASAFRKTRSISSDYSNSGLPRNLFFDFVRAEEVRAAHALEVQGYPPEDAASFERLLSRQKAAPHLFLGAFVPLPPPKVAGPLSVTGPSRRKLLAFITGTAAPALTLRSMSAHDTSEDARIVCIHSVCVSPEFQRRGLATRMLENYIARIRKAEEGKGPEGEKGKRGYETLALLAHEQLTALYKKVGFRIQGHSHIQYGSGQWWEMRRSVYPSPGSGHGSRLDTTLSRTISSTSSTGLASVVVESPLDTTSANRLPADSTPAFASGSPLIAPTASNSTEKEAGPLTAEGANGDAAAISSGGELTKNKADSSPEAPPGMPSQASILAALAAQSKPGPNPGKSYTSILGQAVAAKTPAEDAGIALEARLVNRENNTNLAKLYCPMETCRCLILAKGAGVWTRKESGPLSNPELELPNSPAPPQGPAFPVHAANPCLSNQLLTSVKGFWSVSGPLQFDNIGFSRDMKWNVPLASDAAPPSASASGENSLANSTDLAGAPRSKAQEKEAKDKQRREEKERLRGEKERKKEQKAREKRDKKGGGSGSDSNVSDDDTASLLAHLSLGLTPGEELTVKYLLCPDCECGPLGFTILPADMQGGRLAAQVGDHVERLKGGTRASNTPPPPPLPSQLFYLAADRVRYLFERT